jgi:hypothetical protein
VIDSARLAKPKIDGIIEANAHNLRIGFPFISTLLLNEYTFDILHEGDVRRSSDFSVRRLRACIPPFSKFTE